MKGRYTIRGQAKPSEENRRFDVWQFKIQSFL